MRRWRNAGLRNLRGFVAGPWLDDLDLDGMEPMNTKLHADTGERREGDMIWRIPRRDGEDSYLVLLPEFQSTSDRFMAVRVMIYGGLLWQQLIREGRLAAGGASGLRCNAGGVRRIPGGDDAAAWRRCQLERRFGPLPEWATQRVHTADTAALEEWGLRILDAGSPEGVLDEQPA